MFPRPELNQAFFVKKNGDREIKCFVLMHTYLHCYYQCVPLTRAISGFLFTMLLLSNTKSNKT